MPSDSTRPLVGLVTFRNAFISGALLLAPVIVTFWAFTTIVEVVGGNFRPLYEHYLPETLQSIPFFWDLAATVVVVLLVTTLGYLSNYVLGKYFVSITERVIQRIPGIGSLYYSVKQVVATFGKEKRDIFSKVVLLEFPRKSVWAIGFLTNTGQGEVQTHVTQELWTVFVPTTPNPTSGFLVMVPREDLVPLEMSVSEGMKMIISGGAVVPPWPPAQIPVGALAK